MKILELRLNNLNSLYGKWVIDFTHPEYTSNGIFALTGPTGAGKSTILDAICLALYGATPRLGKITRSGNEIMSRQTGECYAEVLFESQKGRFRAHWEQRRARKKADGRLQDQEHQIVDADTGKPIETKKSLVAGVIEEKTGLDFERFTRSILLAQGGFDTLLKADVEQKSKILEQITGTEIYSEISRLVHVREREERERLRDLKAETPGMEPLDLAEEQALEAALAAKQLEEKALAQKSTETGDAIAWRRSIDGLQVEIKKLSTEAGALEMELAAFEPEREKLDRAGKAASLDGMYATLTAIRAQQSESQAALLAGDARLPELESAAQEAACACTKAERETLRAKDALKEAGPTIRQVRALDQKLAHQKKGISEDRASCDKAQEKIEATQRVRAGEENGWNLAREQLRLVEGYLRDHGQDEWLVSGLAGVEEQLGNLVSRQREIQQKQAEIDRADGELKQAAKRCADREKERGICQRELEAGERNLQQGRDQLDHLLGGRSLPDYRKEKDALLHKMVLFSKIAELSDYRARLEDGAPCPLCGSLEHPFAAGNVPVADAVEQEIGSLTTRITDGEKLEANLTALEGAQGVAQSNLVDAEKREAIALGDRKAAEKALVELNRELEKQRRDFASLKEAVALKLAPLGIGEIRESEVSSLLDALKSRMNHWQAQVAEKGTIEKQIAAIEGEMKRLDGVMETERAALAENRQRLDRLIREHGEGHQERQKLYGDKTPDDEEGRLNEVIGDAERAEKKARDRSVVRQQDWTTAKSQVASLKTAILKQGVALESAGKEFLCALETVGFKDEKGFVAARLTPAQREGLLGRAKGLDDRQTDLKARQNDRETRLAGEIARKISEKSLAELETEWEGWEASKKELGDAIAALAHKLSENSAAKARLQEKSAAIEAQTTEWTRWKNLHLLIGSEDGKKYRNFAQGLTFELMVSHANQQLKKMTDRYLLVRDDVQPLELNVVDLYQDGEIRSTRNLSGGESFIVSLTLALGLSRMASRKVRVDSLFLDEGFGTLDEEALQMALDTLSGLQQDGKLIGIISHISTLKQRIPTHISVNRVSGGRSAIAGPGCGAVENV